MVFVAIDTFNHIPTDYCFCFGHIIITLFHLDSDVAALLLDHDIGEESMLRSSLRGTTLMRKLIAFMPGRLELIPS